MIITVLIVFKSGTCHSSNVGFEGQRNFPDKNFAKITFCSVPDMTY